MPIITDILNKMCQFSESTPIDANSDGTFTEEYNAGVLPSGTYVAPEGDLWPSRFTVLTATNGTTALGFNFLHELGKRIMAANSAVEYQKTIRDFANGIWLPGMWSNDAFAWQAVPSRLWMMDDMPMVKCDDNGCKYYGQTTSGWVGKVGFNFEPKTVKEDAKRRFIIAFHSDIFRSVLFFLKKTELVDFIDNIASKYEIENDHVTWINPWFLDEEDMADGIRATVADMPAKSEVMFVFVSHGDAGWFAKLQSNLIRDDVVMSAADFRKILIENLPPEKVESVLVITHACYDGLLVGESVKFSEVHDCFAGDVPVPCPFVPFYFKFK
ncbi:MAG: hypothetical protein HYT75_02260 [Deltaproteobacteria bacterium]|nr:hypothetical protein [Deltaproteobacteria bacterium]